MQTEASQSDVNLLEAGAEAARFLFNNENIPAALDQTAEVLSHAAAIEGIFFFKSGPRSTFSELQYVWQSEDWSGKPSCEDVAALIVEEIFPRHWGWFEAGEPILVHIEDISGPLHDHMRGAGINSLMGFYRPRRSESGRFGCFIRRRDKNWTRQEQAFLSMAATAMDEVLRRKETEEALQQEAETNKALASLSRVLLTSPGIENIAQQILQSARQLTGSQHGFVGYIEPETGDLVCPTMTREIWEACRMPNKDIRFSHFYGLWGDVLARKEPVVTNEPESYPSAGGLPQGHIPIHNFLSVPAILEGELVGQIALANSHRDYTENDLAILKRLAAYFSLGIQRNRTEERLVDKSAFNQSILNSLSASIAIVDQSGMILKTNSEWDCFALDNGAVALESVGRGVSYLEVCQQAEAEGDLAAGHARSGICRVLEHKAPHFEMEYECDCFGGHRWFLMQVTPLDYKKAGAVIAHIDISERKAIEDRLRDSENRYRALFNSVNDAIYIHDLNGRFLEVNEEACSCLKFDRETLLSKSASQVVAPEFIQDIDKRIRQLYEKEAIFFESVHLAKDGTAVPVEVHSRLINYEGRPTVMSVARDIRDRKQAEQAMQEAQAMLEKRVAERTTELARKNAALKQEIASRREAEVSLQAANEKMQGVMATLGAGLLIVNPEYFIEYQNEVHRRWFGDLHGCSFSPYSPVSSFDELLKHCNRTYTELGESSCELPYAANGMDFEMSFSFFQDADQKEKLIVLQRNVSEKKRLEVETMRASRLASVGELAAGVAHEINNPINGVINYAQILLDGFDEQDREVEDIPARILKEAERVASIVKNLLSFAREAKEEAAPEYIPDLIFDALELVGKQFAKDGIRLYVFYSAGLPKTVVNSQKIQQVFVNLLSNARYALNQRFPGFSSHKMLRIRAYEAIDKNQSWLRIEFIDYGVGMDQEMINRVCDPFFSTKPRGEGTGLGLSISYGIIKDHGGKLSFDSQPGSYTCARVDLPVERNNQAQTA